MIKVLFKTKRCRCGLSVVSQIAMFALNWEDERISFRWYWEVKEM